MAEVLAALGGAAAVAQLLHYTVILSTTASALSYNIRHASEKVQAWLRQSKVMVSIIDEIGSLVVNLDPVIIELLRQCREDTCRLQLLLRPFHTNETSRERSRTRQRMFVAGHEAEIEKIVASFRSTFNTMVSYLNV